MRHVVLFLLLVVPIAAVAQRENTFYVKQFGTQTLRTVGAMTAAAQAQCNSNTSIPCVLVFDPTLAAFSAGTMPVRCAQCVWLDYRSSDPQVNGAPLSSNPLNMKIFGCKGDGASDDSPCFAAAAASIVASRNVVGKNCTTAYLPPGTYLVHEADLSAAGSCFLLAGDNEQSTVIRYNGAGGAGSYVLRFGSLSFGGWRDFIIYGYDAAYTTVAQNGIQITGLLDRMSKAERFRIQGTYGDAIAQTTNAGVVNFAMKHFRFDSIGGFGFTLWTNGTSDGADVEWDEWTQDNNISDASLRTLLTNKGLYDGTHWGMGLIHCNNCRSVNWVLSNGRIETNKALVTQGAAGEASLLYEENTTAGQSGMLILVNVEGTNGQSAIRKYPLVSANVANAMGLRIFASGLYNYLCYIKDRTTGNCVGNRTGNVALASYTSTNNSMAAVDVDSHQEQSRATSAQAGNAAKWGRGDIWWHLATDFVPGATGVGTVMVYPASGKGRFDAATLSTAAVVTSGSATVGLPVDPSTLDLVQGDAITLVGAGAAAANYDASVTAIDYVNKTLTVSPAPSTSVNPATLKWAVPISREFGFDATRRTAAPGSGQWFKGEVVWNSVPAAGSPMGWICTVAGTPGTWVPFGYVGTTPTKAATGQRFVCIDAAGNFVSSATACSGT
jgi:hypothetical protein